MSVVVTTELRLKLRFVNPSRDKILSSLTVYANHGAGAKQELGADTW